MRKRGNEKLSLSLSLNGLTGKAEMNKMMMTPPLDSLVTAGRIGV